MDIEEKSEQVIRHWIATISYRMVSAVKDIPQGFGTFDAGQGVRTPAELVHHMADILGLAHRAFEGNADHEAPMLPWNAELHRFFEILAELDTAVASRKEPQKLSWEQIIQGPLADVMTHIGQLATLRRLAGYPMDRVSYLRASILVGQLQQLHPSEDDR